MSFIFSKSEVLPFPMATHIGIFQIQRHSWTHPVVQQYDREAKKGVEMNNHFSKETTVRKKTNKQKTLIIPYRIWSR